MKARAGIMMAGWMRSRALLLAGSFGLWSETLPAKACSGFFCAGVQVAPSTGTIPANLPAFYVAAGAYADAGAPRLTLTHANGQRAVELDDRHRLLGKLEPGATYKVQLSFAATATCPSKELQTTIVAGPEVPLPSSLGDVVVVKQAIGLTAVGFTGASCYTNLASSYADLEPSLGSAAPWASALVDVRAIVDEQEYWISAERQPEDEIYPTRGQGLRPLTGGRIRVRVFVACEAIPPGSASGYVPLSEGRHRVRLAALLPGVGELRTSETSIELRCASSADAGTTDGNHDGGSSPVDSRTDESKGEDGCGLGPSERDAHAPFILIALALIERRGRPRALRRRTSRSELGH